MKKTSLVAALLALALLSFSCKKSQKTTAPDVGTPADAAAWLSSLGIDVPGGDLSRMAKLDLGKKKVGDDSWKFLLQLPNLVNLSLAETAVTDSWFARTGTFFKLKSLNLAKTRISDGALAYIAKFPALRFLSLTSTKITDRGCERLVGVARLGTLSLRNTRVTDQCVGTLLRIPTLTRLLISNTRITAAGMEQLAGLKKLEVLIVSKAKMTDPVRKKLAANLPGCKIKEE